MAVKVADFFCGCGGTSLGLQDAGMQVILGLDFDRDAANTYRSNFKLATLIEKDISLLTFRDVEEHLHLSPSDSLVFCGCAPCQPFSKIQTKKPRIDGRRTLLAEFGRFVRRFKPDYVVVENVPGLQAIDPSSGPLKEFIELLDDAGYGGNRLRFEVVECQYYGVPQCRRRLVLVATLHGARAVAPENPRTEWDREGKLADRVGSYWRPSAH